MDVLEANDEHHSEAKDQEVEIVEKNVKGLDEIKSNDFKNEDPILFQQEATYQSLLILLGLKYLIGLSIYIC